MAQQHDDRGKVAIQICLNWGADKELVAGEKLDTFHMTTLAELRQQLEDGTYYADSIEYAMASIADAFIMQQPTPEHLGDLIACCNFIATHNNASTFTVCANPDQPLLHRFASLLTKETNAVLNSPEQPLCQSISLAISSLVAAGNNINTLNRDKQTVLDIVLEEAFPEKRKERSCSSEDCALYRRPANLLGKAVTGKHNEHIVKATTFLIRSGARHGLGYLRNTKRQSPLTDAAAKRTAHFLCNTPHTSLADTLLSYDDELLRNNIETIRQADVLTSLLNAAVISSNANLLRQLINVNIGLREHAPLLWGSLANPLHDNAQLLADAQELLALPIPLNKRDALGNTPLHFIVAAADHYQVGSSHWELVELLLNNGASMNARNARGVTPLNMASHALQKFMKHV